MKTLFCWTIVTLLLLPACLVAADLYGFEPARPLSISTPFDIPGVHQLRHEYRFVVLLDVSKTGQITGVRPDDPLDSLALSRVLPHLDNLSFAPASFNGSDVDGTLPIEVHINPLRWTAAFHFPTDPDGNIQSYKLWLQAGELNGIQSPELVRMPTYHFLEWESDSTGDIPYFVVKVTLDSTGQVANIEAQPSTIGSFADQILSALHWAHFSPARVNGSALSSELWLVFAFYPNSSFPSGEWSNNPDDSLAFWDRIRIRPLVDTAGPMLWPVPCRTELDKYGFRGDHRHCVDTVSAWVHVDTTGKARARYVSSREPELMAAVQRSVSKTAFHPAVGFDGQPQAFRGLGIFTFDATTAIRIDWTWLR